MTSLAPSAAMLLVSCLAAVAQVQAGDAHGWRGTVVPPFGSGIRELSGSCIGTGPDGDAMCATSIQVVRDEQSHVRTVLATRRLQHPGGAFVGGDRPLALVTDAIAPEALDDTANDVAVGLCQRDGADDPRIVAIIRPGADVEWLTELHGSWRLDDGGRLQPIPADGVRCRNEGFGYDG